MKLDKSFYIDEDVVQIAKSLIGKELHSTASGVHKAGIIVETEAYSYTEKACHAYLKRNTNRTKTMFMEGGVAYIYLCYGIHHLFNIVTNVGGIPEAILIRALEPLDRKVASKVTSGPGKLTKYLGIEKSLDTTDLTGDSIWIEDHKHKFKLDSSKRIGIDYAEEDANLLWRFTAEGNKWVSK